MELKKYIEDTLYKWVADNFGTQEAEDPCYNLEALAEEIYKHRWTIHSAVQEEYDIEDIERIAEDKGVTLTKEQLSMALHRYNKLEDNKLGEIDYIIDEVRGK